MDHEKPNVEDKSINEQNGNCQKSNTDNKSGTQQINRISKKVEMQFETENRKRRLKFTISYEDVQEFNQTPPKE